MSVGLHPTWKQAIVDFITAGFKEPDIIPYSWLYEHFQITPPTPTMPLREAEVIRWKFRNAFESFEKELLKEHCVALDNEKGIGYRIVPSTEQTRWAWMEGMREINKGMRRLSNRVIFVDDAKLTAAQRRENDDAQARIAALSGMMNRTRRLPKPS